MTWRRIDDPDHPAPQDGARVLVGRFVDGDKFDGLMTVDFWDKKLGFGTFNALHWPATHWQPLPDPPEEE